MKKKLLLVALLAAPGLLNFQPAARAQPVVTTLAATSVTATNATLNGTVNPNGAVAAAYFQYGLTTNYDNLGGFEALPATNAALALPGLVVNALHSPAGATWTQTSATSTNWSAIAASADGAHLAAVVAGGGIYISTNNGSAWTLASAPAANWRSIAASADGTHLAAVVNGGGLYASTNTGVTWTLTSAPITNWASIAASASGASLAAMVDGGGIYTSANSGATWTPTSAPEENWSAIAASADGARLAAVVDGGDGIYTSTNSGNTWTQATSLDEHWLAIAASADGLHLAAVDGFNGGIWTSGDGGATWTLTSAPTTLYDQITSSDDGSRLAATLPNHLIFTSTNAGVTWTEASAPAEVWQGIASSADGAQLAAVATGGGICISTGPVNNVTPGTTCHYQAVGFNGAGTTWGNDLTFTTPAGPPTATTLPASDITTTNALANGTVNPDGTATEVWFQYGPTTAYGSCSTTNSLMATNTPQSVSNLLGGLTENTTWHFRLVAVNGQGTTLGNDLTLATRTLSVATLAATSVSSNAILHGTVNDYGAPAAAFYQYGLTTSYGCLGGFTVLPATNATQTLPGAVVSALPGPAGANWTNTSGPADCISIASSADGARLAAVEFPGGIWVSTNHGVAWTLTSAPSATWESIASSADGLRLAAVPDASANIYTSTNGGATWTTNQAPLADYVAIASSADGSRLAAVSAGYNEGIYLSTNAGATWALSSAPDVFFSSITSSADGVHLAAGAALLHAESLGLYVSTNAGATWTMTDSHYEYDSIASSADGLTVVAGSDTDGSPGGTIAVSYNGGFTWNYHLPANESWRAITCSADGTRMTAAAQDGEMWSSTDSGNTWTQVSAPAADWVGLAASADGSQLAATGYGNGIYTSAGQPASFPAGAVVHYRAVGVSTETDAGGDLTFIVSGAPLATTLAATNINATNAVLYGAVNPGQAATMAYFQYGPTTNYGSYSATSVLAATNVALNVSNLISGLTPGVLYHYQVVASNAFGIAAGADEVFGPTPHAFTGPGSGQGLDLQGPFLYAVGVGATSAAGMVGDANFTLDSVPGVSVTAVGNTLYTINNWASPNFGSSSDDLGLAKVMNSIRWTPAPGILTVNLTGTQIGRDYELQMMFIEEADDREFAVVVNGTTLLPAFRLYDYGPKGTPIVIPYRFTATTTNVLIQLGGGSGVLDNNPTLSALTLKALAPAVTTLAATGGNDTSATLNGLINPEGAATMAWFQYGLTTNYGSCTATNTLAATNATLALSTLVGNLSPGTVYHFQLMGDNGGGATAGGDLTFMTMGVQTTPFNLTGTTLLAGGALQLSFTNVSGANFTVLETTNLALPLTNWTVLGAPVEAPPGQYTFTDLSATNLPQRFYRVSSP